MFNTPEYYPKSIKSLLKTFNISAIIIGIIALLVPLFITIQTYWSKISLDTDMLPLIRLGLSTIAIISVFFGAYLQFKNVYQDRKVSHSVMKSLTLFLVISYIVFNIIGILLIPKTFISLTRIINAQTFILTLSLTIASSIAFLHIFSKVPYLKTSLWPSVIGLLPFSASIILILSTAIPQNNILILLILPAVIPLALNVFFLIHFIFEEVAS